MVKHLSGLFLLLSAMFLLTSCGSDVPQLKPLKSRDVIVAFGDSLTYGTGAAHNANYPIFLEHMIGIRVVNAGVPGEETAAGRKRIYSVLKKYHPKLVILCLGGNDQIRKRSAKQIKENLRRIIQAIHASGAEVLLIAVPKPTITLSVPDFYAELGEELAIPVDEATLADLLSQGNLKSDYIHLNAAGYKEMARLIANKLKEEGALQQ